MAKSLKGSIGCILMAAAFLGVGNGVAAAGVDSLCIQFIGSSGGQEMELRMAYSLRGTLPLNLCDLGRNSKYRLATAGGGFERRIGTLALGERGVSSVSGIRFGAGLRNAVLPGWGSSFSGRAATGWSDALCIAGAAYLFVQEQREYRHIKNRLDVLQEAIATSTSASEAARAQAAAHEASRDLNIQNRHRERLAIATAALYAYQVIDPWLSARPPSYTLEARGNVVRLDGTRNYRVKAFLQSVVRPGRGQFYQGKTKRGVLFSSATAAGGLIAFEYHNRYDRAVGDYETCIERFNATDDSAERERLRDEASALWSDVTRERDRRNGAYAALAGLWAWNLIDTFFSGEAAIVRSGYSVDYGAQGIAVVFRF